MTCLSHVPETGALCVAASSGHLLLVDCISHAVEEVCIADLSRSNFSLETYICCFLQTFDCFLIAAAELLDCRS